MSGTQDLKRHYLILISVLSLSIIALLVTAILVIKPRIERDLTQKVSEKLKQQGIDVKVSFSGRDGVIKGTIKKSDIEKAEESAYEVCGIHFIDNQLIAREEGSQSPDKITLNQATANPQEYSETKKDKPTDTTASEGNKEESTEIAKTEVEERKPTKSVTETKENNQEKKDIVEEDKVKEEPDTTVTAKKESETDISKNDTPIDKKSESGSAKGNVQEYEKMLAAMTVYNKNTKKSRNASSLSNSTPFNIDTTNIAFITGSSSIESSSYKTLDKLAEKLNGTGEKKFNIKVTAVDSELAFHRAKSLRTYLVARGIKKHRLIITGKGDSNGHSISISEED